MLARCWASRPNLLSESHLFGSVRASRPSLLRGKDEGGTKFRPIIFPPEEGGGLTLAGAGPGPQTLLAPSQDGSPPAGAADSDSRAGNSAQRKFPALADQEYRK